MMSGQAAVAVAVSGVQVISAAASIWGKPRTFASDGSAEERSAFMFFALSTLFLIASGVAHRWLIRTPAYQRVAASLEREQRKTRNEDSLEDERLGLISSEPLEVLASNVKANAIRVGKQNLPFEIAVAYVFLTTLVRSKNIVDIHQLMFSVFRLSSLL